MRYINKEYGFTFRPPFFDKFYEELNKGPALSNENFPGKYIIGAGYDYSAINGAVFCGKNGSLWGMRVLYHNGKKWLDNDDFIRHLGVGCANTPDGSFAHFSSGPLSVKWARHNEQSMAVEVSARKKLRVRVIFYPVYQWPGELSIEGSFVKGRSPHVGVVGGDITLTDACAVYKNRYQVIKDDSPEREFFMAQSYVKPADTANGAFNEAIMEFWLGKGLSKIYIYACVGEESVLAMEVPRIDKVVKLIETSELRYGVDKASGTGHLGRSVEGMMNSILWSRIYYPYLLQVIHSPKRALLNNHFDLSGTDENCAALLAAYIGGARPEAQLKYTVDDRIMALMTVWHIFMHSNDKDGFCGLYDRLKLLYPPSDTALITSSDASLNEIAYKWTDSPLKETEYGQAMHSLDLSCFKLMAFDTLERMSAHFDDRDAEKEYRQAKKELIKLINSTFWNEQKGMYLNRYVTGTWALHSGATGFYPLAAGAVDTPDKLSRLVNSLTDPRKFWGEYPVPTLSRDDENYGKRKVNPGGRPGPAYLQYRGSVVPYVNYLLYHGLVRYGLDRIAGEVAYKSVMLWRNTKDTGIENYSMYLPNGKRIKSREYLSNTGNMLALMGVQELIDIDYFRPDRKVALRFGTFVRGSHSVTNIRLLSRSYSVEVGPLNTTLLIDGKNLFKAEGGRCVVRQFLKIRGGYEFLIDAQSVLSVNVYVYKDEDTRKDYALHFDVPEGKSRVRIEDKQVTILVIF